MPLKRPPFPTYFDASMISTLRSCGRKFELEYLREWKPQSSNVHLHAGGAYARGLEVARKAFYLEGQDRISAENAGMVALAQAYGDFVCPPTSAKTLDRMLGALEFYFDQYPLGADGTTPIRLPGNVAGIEFRFATPLGISHPETGDPILYVGRSDMVAEWNGGTYIYDDKTTSQLGASWSQQWDLRSQFTGYCWSAREHGIPVTGAMVRGVSILKTKYETQQAVTYRPDWQITRWYQQVIRDITRAIRSWELGLWDYDLDQSCNAYGGCPYKQLCLSPNPDAYLPIYFERRHWDPINATEVVLGPEETTDEPVSA